MNKEQEFLNLLKSMLPNSSYLGKVFAVGGFVRDKILGIESKDLDLVVESQDGAQKVTEWLKKELGSNVTSPYQIGKGYPIWQISVEADINYQGKLYKVKGVTLEFADSQKEAFPDHESRQRISSYGSIEEDIKRRDFTVNMLLLDVSTNKIKDLAGGLEDIREGVLRGHPDVDLNKTFSDDPLRMLRLIRFQSKYNWKVPLSVLRMTKNQSKRIEIISGERIQGELQKVAQIKKLGSAFRLMSTTGLFPIIFPNAKEDKEMFRKLNEQSFAPAMAKIYEDCNDKITEQEMRKLKFDVSVIREVLIIKKFSKDHPDFDSYDALEVRKLARQLREGFNNFLDYHKINNKEINSKILSQALQKKITYDPLISGEEIIEKFSLTPGKIIGDINKFLFSKSDEASVKGEDVSKEDLYKFVTDEFQLICQKCGRKYKLSTKGSSLTHGPRCNKIEN